MKLFADLPMPKNDEVFSSWIYRCAHSNKSRRQGRHLLELGVRYVASTPDPTFEDPDFDSQSEYFVRACNILNIDLKIATELFTKHAYPIVPWDQRAYFCTLCVREDIASGALPSWRKSWCYDNSIMCGVHRTELTILEQFPTSSKAWDAFCQTAQYSFEVGRWESDKFLRLRFLCLCRILRWLRAQQKNEPALSQAGVYLGLYSNFLKVSTIRYPPGLARRLFYKGIVRNFRDGISFLDCMIMGPSYSPPRNRFASIALLGWLLEILTCRQMTALLNKFSDVAAYFPRDLHDVSRNVLGIGGLDHYLEFKNYLGLFFRPLGSRLDLFLADQERACNVYFAVDQNHAFGCSPADN